MVDFFNKVKHKNSKIMWYFDLKFIGKINEKNLDD